VFAAGKVAVDNRADKIGNGGGGNRGITAHFYSKSVANEGVEFYPKTIMATPSRNPCKHAAYLVESPTL
jgi:hypothetical protein